MAAPLRVESTGWRAYSPKTVSSHPSRLFLNYAPAGSAAKASLPATGRAFLTARVAKNVPNLAPQPKNICKYNQEQEMRRFSARCGPGVSKLNQPQWPQIGPETAAIRGKQGDGDLVRRHQPPRGGPFRFQIPGHGWELVQLSRSTLKITAVTSSGCLSDPENSRRAWYRASMISRPYACGPGRPAGSKETSAQTYERLRVPAASPTPEPWPNWPWNLQNEHLVDEDPRQRMPLPSSD